MRRALAIAAVGGFLLSSQLVAGSARATASPAPRRAARAQHHPLVIVWLENHTASQITRAAAPFLTTLKTRGRYFSNYYGVADPSLPNYVAFASGSTHGKVGTDSITAGELPGTTIWRQLTKAGVSWGVYQEAMPSRCYRGTYANNARTGPYVLRHNPATPFGNILRSAACQRVRPLSAMPWRLPQVSFVTPAICNDMHGVGDTSMGASCRTGTQALITRGDRWMHVHVKRWRSRGATVVITFDEGGSALYTVVVGNGVRRGVNHLRYTHYSLLAGLERRFGLSRLGKARAARPLPLGP